MPYTRSGDYIESRTNKNTDIRGYGEIDGIPDFRLHPKFNPHNNRLVFSADVSSVFDIV